MTFQNIEQLLVLPFRIHYYDQYVMGKMCFAQTFAKVPSKNISQFSDLKKKKKHQVKVIKYAFFCDKQIKTSAEAHSLLDSLSFL